MFEHLNATFYWQKDYKFGTKRQKNCKTFAKIFQLNSIFKYSSRKMSNATTTSLTKLESNWLSTRAFICKRPLMFNFKNGWVQGKKPIYVHGNILKSILIKERISICSWLLETQKSHSYLDHCSFKKFHKYLSSPIAASLDRKFKTNRENMCRPLCFIAHKGILHLTMQEILFKNRKFCNARLWRNAAVVIRPNNIFFWL